MDTNQNLQTNNENNLTFVPHLTPAQKVMATQSRIEPNGSNVESLLGTIASNQVLMYEELKRKNKYEAWKTFFAGAKIIIYVAIIYVSYIGMLQLMEKLESGELTKNLMPQFDLEQVISGQSNSPSGIANAIQGIGRPDATDGAVLNGESNNLISSLINQFKASQSE